MIPWPIADTSYDSAQFAHPPFQGVPLQADPGTTGQGGPQSDTSELSRKLQEALADFTMGSSAVVGGRTPYIPLSIPNPEAAPDPEILSAMTSRVAPRNPINIDPKNPIPFDPLPLLHMLAPKKDIFQVGQADPPEQGPSPIQSIPRLIYSAQNIGPSDNFAEKFLTNWNNNDFLGDMIRLLSASKPKNLAVTPFEHENTYVSRSDFWKLQ